MATATNTTLEKLTGSACPHCDQPVQCREDRAYCLPCVESGRDAIWRLPSAVRFRGLRWESNKVFDSVYTVTGESGLWASPVDEGGQLLAVLEFLPGRRAVVRLVRASEAMESKLRGILG